MTIHFYGRIVEVLLMIGNFFGRLRIRFCNGISFAELCGLYMKWRQLSHWGEDAISILKSHIVYAKRVIIWSIGYTDYEFNLRCPGLEG